ncbi:hypothetical protein Tco_1484121 [Tanacetum coccineum]
MSISSSLKASFFEMSSSENPSIGDNLTLVDPPILSFLMGPIDKVPRSTGAGHKDTKEIDVKFHCQSLLKWPGAHTQSKRWHVICPWALGALAEPAPTDPWPGGQQLLAVIACWNIPVTAGNASSGNVGSAFIPSILFPRGKAINAFQVRTRAANTSSDKPGRIMGLKWALVTEVVTTVITQSKELLLCLLASSGSSGSAGSLAADLKSPSVSYGLLPSTQRSRTAEP